MSSSNHHHGLRLPEPSLTRRKRCLDPGLETIPKRHGTDRNFDGMIEAMSGSPRDSHRKNKKRTGRTYSHMDRAYRLPSPEHLKNRLSFVKLDPATSSSPLLCDARRSSDCAQVSHASTSRRNPLPEWLANTFMSLSKKHPLRLLLPSDLAQAFPGESPSSGTEPAETDGLFAFIDVPARNNNPDEGHNDSQFQKIASYTNGTMFASVVRDPDLPEPLPYSTPGPASHLGGFSVGSKTTLSAASLQTSSSPTLFNIDGHLPLYKQSHQPIADPSTAFRHYDGLLLGELEDDPYPLPLADPYLSQIYATPGPMYRALATQSDSPTGDLLTLESEVTLSRLTTGDNLLDFHWRPFNRKTLVAPVLSKAPAFACDGKSKTNSTTVNTDRPPLAISQTRDADQPPISPSPFSFSPLDIRDTAVNVPAESAIDPESHDPPKVSGTPPLQMLPSALVPTIYSLPSGRTPGSLSLAETGIFSKVKAVPEGERYADSEDSFMLHDGHNLDSERSLDSVEFWNN